jgi:hypothetical protein
MCRAVDRFTHKFSEPLFNFPLHFTLFVAFACFPQTTTGTPDYSEAIPLFYRDLLSQHLVMDAKVTALLLPQGLDSTEDLEKDISSIRLKLEKARDAKHVLLIPQLLKKLEKRQDLKRKIDGESCDASLFHKVPFGLMSN